MTSSTLARSARGDERAVAPGGPRIPPDLRKRGRVLLHQQLWLFGQDIRRPEGNALLEYGFTRRRPPAGEAGGNAYTWRCATGPGVVLWGFGVYYREAGRGGIFLPRFTFTPRLTRSDEAPEAAWRPAQLPATRPPRTPRQWACTRQLLIPALRWIAAYERWVLALRGLDYRRCCVAAWPKASVPAEELSGAWEALAARCDATIGDVTTRRG